MTALPPATSFAGASVTQGNFKTAMTNLVAFLQGLLGTDGTATAAKTALGLATVATSGNYNDLSNLPSTGSVTNVGTGAGLTGGPITLSGTLAVDPTYFMGFVGGLALSNSSSTALGISAGAAVSDDGTTLMNLAVAITKTTSAWAVGSGNGGLDAGTIAASTWYHFYEIERTDTGVVDVVFSLSASAPTMPGSYAKKRRIGSWKTDGSSHWLTCTQTGTGNRRCYLMAASSADVGGTTASTANRTLYTLGNVPSGIKVDAIIEANLIGTGTGVRLARLTSPDENDVAVGDSSANMFAENNNTVHGGNRYTIRTNTSAQIAGRANFADTLNIQSIGWYDDI